MTLTFYFVSILLVGFCEGAVEIENGRCNSRPLAEIMKQTMSGSPEHSRDAIHDRARQQLGGDFGVVCSMDDIASAIMPTELFCEARLNDMVCLAFKRG